jgi:DNA-binding Lrp family transcriptional regulator
VSRQVDKKETSISDLDRKLLKILLMPNGDLKSNKSLSAKLGILITTIRRRGKRLEREFLKIHYVLDIEKFGWRRIDFFISISIKIICILEFHIFIIKFFNCLDKR